MSNLDTIKARKIADQHKKDMAQFGYKPTRREVGQHVWHDITPDERAEVMELVGGAKTSHRRYVMCVDYIAGLVD